MRSLAVATCVLFSSMDAYAENWPQWRGPSLNGISAESNLPVKWTTTENIAWKLPLPAWSGSTPIVWGDRIFLNVAENGSLFLWAVDRTKGEAIWKRHLSDGDHRERKQNMSTPSPVTDGTSVWVMTGTGILKAFDFAGKELWTRDIQKEYGRFGLQWGYGSSPMLYGDSLFVQVLHGMKTDDPSYVLRISKTNGRTIWRQERPDQRPHGIARLVHNAGDRPERQRSRAGHYGRRRGDRARREHRQGIVARQRPEPDQ